MSALQGLETKLDEVFVKKAPFQLPDSGRKMLAEWLPWIDAVGGLLILWSAFALWHWAHIANEFIDAANAINRAYGTGEVVSSRMGVGIWLGMIVLIIEAVLYLAAFPALRARKKSGWNLLFYASLLNVVYGVVVFFTDYGGIGNLIGSLIGTAIGLYLLFQIRGQFTGGGAVHATHPPAAPPAADHQ